MKNSRQPTASRVLINQPKTIGMAIINIPLIIYNDLSIKTHYSGPDYLNADFFRVRQHSINKIAND